MIYNSNEKAKFHQQIENTDTSKVNFEFLSGMFPLFVKVDSTINKYNPFYKRQNLIGASAYSFQPRKIHYNNFMK